MPNIAKIVDHLREVFGDGIKVTYAKENGYEVGTPCDRTKLVKPCIDMNPALVPQRRRK